MSASPAIFRGGGNRLVKRAQCRRRGNFFEEIGSVGIARAQFGELRGRSVTKISLREAINSFLVKAAGVARIAGAFGVAAEKIKSVNRVGGNRIFLEEAPETIVGIGSAIQIRDPGDAPFGVEIIFAVGIGVEDALVILSSFVAIEINPIVVTSRHERFVGPARIRIFLQDRFDGSEHRRVIFFGALELREGVKALRVHFRVSRGERRD